MPLPGQEHERGFPLGLGPPLLSVLEGQTGEQTPRSEDVTHSTDGCVTVEGRSFLCRDQDADADNPREILTLGKGVAFVKSRLEKAPSKRGDHGRPSCSESRVWGWNARRHGELWLGMVLTRLEQKPPPRGPRE